MSSDDVFYNQFEKFLKIEHNISMNEFKELFIEKGDGFRERFEKISEVLLLHSPNDKKEEIKEWKKQ